MYVEGEGAPERQARSSWNATGYQLLLRHPKTSFVCTMVTMVHLLALGILTVHISVALQFWSDTNSECVKIVSGCLHGFGLDAINFWRLGGVKDTGESTKRRACFTGVNKSKWHRWQYFVVTHCCRYHQGADQSSQICNLVEFKS